MVYTPTPRDWDVPLNAATGSVYRLVVRGTADNPSDASPGTLTVRARLGGVAGTVLATAAVITVQWSENAAGYVLRADSGYGIRIA